MASPYNPLTAGGQFAMRDVYPNRTSADSTASETVPESTEQAALTNTETETPTVKTKSIGIWFIVLLLAFIVFNVGR